MNSAHLMARLVRACQARTTRLFAQVSCVTAHARQASLWSVLLVGAALMQGCATRQNPDPLEPWNRKVFGFNETVDEYVLAPAARGYKAVTPEPVRTGFGNFVGNLKDIWSTLNLFLQGRVSDGLQGVMRVSVNSTFGFLGVIDIATPMRLYRANEDFGQTLGVWGVGPGAYIVWPILGSSTLRDSVSLPGDLYFSSSTLADSAREANVLRVVEAVHTRATYLDAGALVSDVALDKYAFLRDAYLQRRQNLIYEGDPPQDDDDAEPDDGDDGVVYAPASVDEAAPEGAEAASAPMPAASDAP